MKTFISTLAAASMLLSSTPAIAAPANSVFFYDQARAALRGVSVTQAVLDGTIYPEIERVHPLLSGSGVTVDADLIKAANEHAENRRKRNREAVQEHCRRERRVSKPADENRCGPGLKK